MRNLSVMSTKSENSIHLMTSTGINADIAPFWCIWMLVSIHGNYAKITCEVEALKPA